MKDLFYLIANAPPIPDWFRPSGVGECPKCPSVHARLSDVAVHMLYEFGYTKGVLSREDEALLQGRYAAQKQYNAIHAWRKNYRKELDLQWPIYWATQMLERTHDL